MNQQLETTNRAEINPFRPEVPSELRGLSARLYDFLGETVESQYEQHNLGQAGDTTYSWELLTKVDLTRRFTLGSLGRFYHPTFGIIQARYCQFVDMRATQWLGAPVGLKKSAGLTWQVTNDRALSHSTLVIGVGGQYVAPPNESFGWVITNGPNIQSLPVDADWPEFTRLGWAGNDLASADDVDSTFGSLLVIGAAPSIPPGQFFVDSIQVSDRQLRVLLAEQVSDVKLSISALSTRFDGFIADQFAPLAARVNSVETSLGTLTQQTRALDLKIVEQTTALGRRIDALAGASGGSYVTSGQFTEYRGTVDSSLGVLQQRVTANQEDIARINAVITGIDGFEFESLVELANRVRSLTFLNLADTPLVYTGAENFLLRVNTAGTGVEFYDPAGLLSGYIPAPGPTQVDNSIVRWDGTGGNQIQGSAVVVDDSGNITDFASIRKGTGLTYAPTLGLGTLGTVWPAGTSAFIEHTETLDATATATRAGLILFGTVTGTGSAQAHQGVNALYTWNSSGSLTSSIAASLRSNHTGSGLITNAIGARAQVIKSGSGGITVATALAASVQAVTGTGVIATAYAVRIAAQKSSTITTAYGIAQEGANDLNFFAGPVRFGSSTAATNPISVTGNADISGNLSVADEAYDSTTWNGSANVPTKNAIRDKIEAMAIGTAGVTEHSGDSNTSYTWGTTKRVLLLSGTLTAGRTLTLNTSGAVEGAMVRIVRTGAGAFDWSVGTGPLKLLAANTWCDVAYNGSAWILVGYGTL